MWEIFFKFSSDEGSLNSQNDKGTCDTESCNCSSCRNNRSSCRRCWRNTIALNLLSCICAISSAINLSLSDCCCSAKSIILAFDADCWVLSTTDRFNVLGIGHTLPTTWCCCGISPAWCQNTFRSWLIGTAFSNLAFIVLLARISFQLENENWIKNEGCNWQSLHTERYI